MRSTTIFFGKYCYIFNCFSAGYYGMGVFSVSIYVKIYLCISNVTWLASMCFMYMYNINKYINKDHINNCAWEFSSQEIIFQFSGYLSDKNGWRFWGTSPPSLELTLITRLVWDKANEYEMWFVRTIKALLACHGHEWLPIHVIL